MSLLYSRLILAVGALLVDVCHKQVVTAQNYQLTSSCGGSVQAGGSCTLMCYTGEASHTTIQWLAGTATYTVTQGSCSTTSTSPSLPADYTASCPSATNYTITINNAVYGRDTLRWSCDFQYGGRTSNRFNISVLVPLSSVTITRTTTSISCVVVSNPPPSMTLYRDGISVATSPAAVEGYTGWTATINYQLTGNSRNSLYYCQASNTQTTVNSTYSYPEIAVSSVSLTTITSANQEVGAAEGQPLNLTCVTSASYPAATVTWYKNSVEVTVGISSSSTVTSGVAVQTTSTVTFNSVVRSDLGHTVYCRATNIHTSSTVQSDSARMGVWFGPEQAGVSKPDNTVAVENRDLNLTCTVTAYPSPTFTWDYSDGTPVGGSTGFVTGSSTRWSQTFTFRPTKDKTAVRCQVSNTRTSATQTGSISLDVKYPPPDSPSITRFRTVMFDGDPETVSCSVTGGNPLATITWSCPGTGSTSVSDSGQTRTSTLSFTVSRSQNSQQCQCLGAWQYGGYNLTDVRTFNISYAPSKPSITVPPVLCEGRPASSLGCTSSDPGNPAASYTWTKNSLPVSPNFSPSRTDNRATMTCSAVNIFTNRTGHTASVSDARQINVHYSPQMRTQPTPNLTRKEGESLSLTCVSDSNPSTSDSDIKWVFGGVETQGPGLQKTNLSRYDDGVYTCRAAVNSGTCGSLQGHREVKVTVNYAPDVNMREADLTEGQTLWLLCHAEGRPSVYTFTHFTQYWGDTKIESRDGQQDRDNYTLTIDSATYLDTGMYECGVDNTVTDRNDVLVQSKRVSVIIRASPKLSLGMKKDARSAAVTGESVTLYRTYYSEPKYNNYTWTRGGQTLTTTHVTETTIQLDIHGVLVEDRGYNFTLDIGRFDSGSTGHYSLHVCNSVNCVMTTVELIVGRSPDAPTQFRLLDNETTTSVWLTWMATFDGGYPQEFVLEYRKFGSAAWNVYGIYRDTGVVMVVEVDNLTPGETYVFRLYARNSKYDPENPSFVFLEAKTIAVPMCNEATNTGLIAGCVIGTTLLIFLVGGLTYALLYRKGYRLVNTQQESSSANRNHETEEMDNMGYSSLGNVRNSPEVSGQYTGLHMRETDTPSQSQKHLYENTKDPAYENTPVVDNTRKYTST